MPRRDILLDSSISLGSTDSNGDWTGDWIDTEDVFAVGIVAAQMNSNLGQLIIEESADASSTIYAHVFTAVSGQVRVEKLTLSTRYFRIRLDNANEAAVRLSVRALSDSNTPGRR